MKAKLKVQVQGLAYFLIKKKKIPLAGFGLPDLQHTAHLEALDLSDFQLQQVPDAETAVDAHDEEQVIPRPGDEQPLDCPDILNTLDGIDDH